MRSKIASVKARQMLKYFIGAIYFIQGRSKLEENETVLRSMTSISGESIAKNSLNVWNNRSATSRILGRCAEYGHAEAAANSLRPI